MPDKNVTDKNVPDSNNYQPSDRRPLTTRGHAWVHAIVRWLVRRGVSANAISVSSTFFAVAAAAAIVGASHMQGVEHRVLWCVAAACVQLRLLANLLDGMVAMETGQASPLGELFNEVPDRISDVLILVALGFVRGSSVHLAYSAAILAVFVSYIRAMGGVAGAGQVFAGIMAKPHRMFFVTLLCLFQALAPASWTAASWTTVFPTTTLLPGDLGPTALVLAAICLGCVVLSFTRLAIICKKLRSAR